MTKFQINVFSYGKLFRFVFDSQILSILILICSPRTNLERKCHRWVFYSFHKNFFISGEKLTEAEVDELLEDCVDPEDDEGMIPYVRKYLYFYWIY